MSKMQLRDYQTKFNTIVHQTTFHSLPSDSQNFIRAKALKFHFTQQELRQLVEISLDLEMWGYPSLADLWPSSPVPSHHRDRPAKKRLISIISSHWKRLKSEPNHYPAKPTQISWNKPETKIKIQEKATFGLGACPVASEKTRCCNLMTLDAVANCGFNCSYCSIQSFYSGNQVIFDPELATKLAAIDLDPRKIYHIGTGQSSDSLMWGNSNGLEETLITFARDNPNVILELKSKSANITHLLKGSLPPNLICTWSLNTPTLITHEEHGTASLEKRMAAARRIADSGTLVGFHLHPIIHYDSWREDYMRLIQQLQSLFQPEEVALISLGTLTFTKPVLRKIRDRGISSQILKMPLTEADGKLSYPEEIKLELFNHCYNAFTPAWKSAVFFYLCMENQRFWKPLFGYDYQSNDEFEMAMKQHYLAKIERTKMNRYV